MDTQQILNKYNRPLFNLYKESRDLILKLPGQTPTDITALPFEKYGPELRAHIIVLDLQIFADLLLEVNDIKSFMDLTAKRSDLFAEEGFINKWFSAVEFIIANKVLPDNFERCNLILKWIEKFKVALASLDKYGWALIVYHYYDGSFEYGTKTEFLKSFPSHLSGVKSDTFRKAYAEVEKEDWQNSPTGKNYFERIKPLLEVWQK